MSGYQCMMDYRKVIQDTVSSYEEMISKSPDEQDFIESEVQKRIKCVSESAIRNAFVSGFSGRGVDEQAINSIAYSDRMDEYIYGVQYDLVKQCVILERALELSSAANPTYEQLSTGEWIS